MRQWKRPSARKTPALRRAAAIRRASATSSNNESLTASCPPIAVYASRRNSRNCPLANARRSRSTPFASVERKAAHQLERRGRLRDTLEPRLVRERAEQAQEIDLALSHQRQRRRDAARREERVRVGEEQVFGIRRTARSGEAGMHRVHLAHPVIRAGFDVDDLEAVVAADRGARERGRVVGATIERQHDARTARTFPPAATRRARRSRATRCARARPRTRVRSAARPPRASVRSAASERCVSCARRATR